METFSFHPANFRESDAILKNPCCGFYRLLSYTPEDRFDVQGWIAEFLDPQADSLLLLEINLKNYAGTDMKPVAPARQSSAEHGFGPAVSLRQSSAQQGLSPDALEQIETIFSTASKNNTDLIVRFLYDTEGTPEKTEPEDLRLVQKHIRQLAPLVNRHRDCIYILQGCLVGAYGEMHGGQFADPALQKELVTLLAKETDPAIFLAVRTPALQRLCTESALSVKKENAFAGSLPARLGLFNDGLFGSETDLGTYGTASEISVPAGDLQAEDHWKVAGNRAAERAFQEALCAYVPNGGEAVGITAFSVWPGCIYELMQLHISYLHDDYDPELMALWKEKNCSDTEQYLKENGSGTKPEKNCPEKEQSCTSSVFEGASIYDYIGAHLGYRYVVTSTDIEFVKTAQAGSVPAVEAAPRNPDDSYPSGESCITFRITIENRGFSPAYRKFETKLTLTPKADPRSMPDAAADVLQTPGKKENRTLSYAIPFDNRFLTGNGGTAELTCSVPTAALSADSYEVRLSMREPLSGKVIHFANAPEGTSVFLGTLE